MNDGGESRVRPLPMVEGGGTPAPGTPGAVSVIIVASRPALLARCLESLTRADLPFPGEVLVVLNGSAPECGEVVVGFQGRIPGLRGLASPGLPPGAARNLALAAASGDLLCFLDDDAAVDPGYFRVLREKSLLYPEAAALGGPERTPPDSPVFERCAGRVLESWTFAGPMSRRAAGFPRDSWTDERGLILCNLVLRAGALKEEGLRFDPELERNEENLLLARLARAGRRAVHCPDLRVFHRRRSGPGGFLRQCRLSGRGRAAMAFRLPGTLRAWHALPLAAVLCALWTPAWPAVLGPWVAAYLATVVAEGFWRARRDAKPLRALLWHAFLVPAGHLAYAAGMAEFASNSLMKRRARACGDGRGQAAPCGLWRRHARAKDAGRGQGRLRT